MANRKSLRALGLVIVVLLVTGLQLRYAASDSRSLGQAFREDRDGWIFVHIEGDPRDRGYQHGVLLAPEIDDFITTLKVYLLQNTTKDWQFYREAAREIFLPKLEPEYLQELEGIAAGVRDAGYSYDVLDLVVENGYFELSDYYLPSIGFVYEDGTSPRSRISPPLRCSAFIATGDWTKDGNIVMAHNSWDDYIMGQRWKIIMDIAPTTGHRLLMQTAPGFIHSGTDFNINAAGIVISETTIGNFRGFDTQGLPEFMRARKAAQYSSSLDDFVTIMRTGNNGGYANAWLIGDIKTGEIGKLELGLVNVAFYRSTNGYYDGENYVDDSKMIAEEASPTLWITHKDWPFDLRNANAITARRLRWQALMTQYKGQIDAELGKSFVADQFEQALHKINPGGYVLMARMEISNRPEVPGVIAPRPFGANEGKVITAALARDLSFWARMGHPDGSAFSWGPFLKRHPRFAWQAPYLRDLETNPWALFASRDQ
jgi:Phospholipase B